MIEFAKLADSAKPPKVYTELDPEEWEQAQERIDAELAAERERTVDQADELLVDVDLLRQHGSWPDRIDVRGSDGVLRPYWHRGEGIYRKGA
jgi:hypothetical protein